MVGPARPPSLPACLTCMAAWPQPGHPAFAAGPSLGLQRASNQGLDAAAAKREHQQHNSVERIKAYRTDIFGLRT